MFCYRWQELKHSIFIVSLAVVSVSCNTVTSAHEELSDSKQEHIQQYLETAEHLSDDQRKAMSVGKPFIGMTYEEVTMVMTLVERQANCDGKILEAEFKNMASQRYNLLFDCGEPNRVKQWSVFTDVESEEFTKFRDVHPGPPYIMLPPQMKK
jgi:hypothetical protein